MTDNYWQQFSQSGKVDAYLSYREQEACRAIADEYAVLDGTQAEVSKGESINHSDRNGAEDRTGWRL